MEERRQRLARRAMMRKINKPLVNKHPGPEGGRYSYHNRICGLPLETLKKMLDRYKPNLRSRFPEKHLKLECLDHPISTSEAIELLRSEFNKYLNQRVDIASKAKLRLDGRCFEGLKDMKNSNYKNDMEKKETQVTGQPSPNHSELKDVIQISRKEAFTHISFKQLEKQYRLNWHFSQERGALTEKNSKRKKISMEDTAVAFDSRRNIKVDHKFDSEKKEGLLRQPLKKLITSIQNKAVIHIFIPDKDIQQISNKMNSVPKHIKNVIHIYITITSIEGFHHNLLFKIQYLRKRMIPNQ